MQLSFGKQLELWGKMEGEVFEFDLEHCLALNSIYTFYRNKRQTALARYKTFTFKNESKGKKW